MIIKQKEWDECVKVNDDPYGKACVDVARRVREILDKEPEFNCHTIICRAGKEVEAGGITGFMAGCVAQMVSRCHDRGEDFRQRWNQDHGADESQAKGRVVDPAVITIET